jgi:hypothetical protein
MNKVYLLFYDTDFGCREEWNTFYTPCEVFVNPTDRDMRIQKIKEFAIQSNEGPFEFHTEDLDVMNSNSINEDPFHDT